jgi:hypothetical protein
MKPHFFKKVLFVKLLITSCLLAIFVHPIAGQVLGVSGSLLWLWCDKLVEPGA